QHDRRTGKVQAFHQQAGKVEHGKTLATTRGPKISASLSVSMGQLMLFNILKKLGGRIVLGVAAEDLLLFLRTVRQVDKIMDNVTEPMLVQHSPDQRVHGVYAMHLGGKTSL